jgi:hypothetical protein
MKRVNACSRAVALSTIESSHLIPLLLGPLKLSTPFAHYAGATCRVKPSAIRELFALIGRPDVISLAGGFPGETALDLRDCGAREACDGRRDAVRDQRRTRPYIVQGNDAARRHVLLGRGPDTGALLAQAVQRGGAFVPGAPFYAGEPERNRLGHSFASATTEQIAEGIRRLRDIHAESKRIADRDGSVEPQ